MIFAATEDIEAPIDVVFGEISNFDSFERMAIQRGISVQRMTQDHGQDAVLSWDIEFEYRGKTRAMLAELTEINQPSAMLIQTDSGGVTGQMSVDLVALSRNRTRLNVALELLPQSLSARLLLQSLRLAKSQLTKRYRQRVGVFAFDIEERFNNA